MQSFLQVVLKKTLFRRYNATCMKINLYVIALIIFSVSISLNTIVLCDENICDYSLNNDDCDETSYIFKSKM